MDPKEVGRPTKIPRFPSLPGASDWISIYKALLDHFFPAKEPPLSRGRLSRHPTAKPLVKEEIAHALSKSSPSSDPTPNGVLYSVWKKVTSVTPDILLHLPSPLVGFG